MVSEEYTSTAGYAQSPLEEMYFFRTGYTR